MHLLAAGRGASSRLSGWIREGQGRQGHEEGTERWKGREVERLRSRCCLHNAHLTSCIRLVVVIVVVVISNVTQLTW